MKNKKGCLVIHGFAGSRREVLPLLEALEHEGYTVACPQLKGHTGLRKDLSRVGYNEWITSAATDLECLQQSCEEVFIVGFSMGGLIGIQLALKYPVSALITINTPVYYIDVLKMARNVIKDVVTLDYSNIRRYLRSTGKVPLVALVQFRRLVAGTKQLVERLSLPLMIIQAKDDDVVPHKSAGYLYDHATAIGPHLVYYSKGGHVILLSPYGEDVIEDVLSFLETQTKDPKTGTVAAIYAP